MAKEIFAVAAIVLAVTACRPAGPVTFGDLEFEVPVAFDKDYSRGKALGFTAEDWIGIYRPRITVSRIDRLYDREAIRRDYDELKKTGMKMSSLEQTTLGGQQAWSYTSHYVDSAALLVHNRRDPNWKPIEPSRVDSREVVVLIPYATSTYSLEFRCPEAFYEKYKPEFEAILRSVSFRKRAH